ncbi:MULTISPECIES: GntR family transcriptional regulator [unclassified Rhizobium]|uniref:GntR family transcriptional regulator n=1 Tax=unclassified Rhizobium TaxID=2613769 RepID=UPI00381CDAF4
MQDERRPPFGEPDFRPDSSKAGAIYQRIKSVLLMHRVPPSTFLNIRTLAAALKVSPTPVREALIRLANEEIILQAPSGRGFFSRPPRLDELAGEYEAAMIAVTHTLFKHGSKLVAADLGPAPAKRRPSRSVPLVATDIAAWIAWRERLYRWIVRASENAVLQRLVDRFIEAARFLTAHDLAQADRFQEVADALYRCAAALGSGAIAEAASILELQNAAEIALIPDHLHSVLRKAAIDDLTLEAVLAAREDVRGQT